MRLRSRNRSELIPAVFADAKNVCTRNSVKRKGLCSTKRSRAPNRVKNGRVKSLHKNTTIEIMMQTKELEVIDLPSFHSWVVKKRRTLHLPKSIRSFYYMPSIFSGTYTQLSTLPEPRFLSSKIQIQNTEKENTIVYTDVMEDSNTPPQPNTKKRQLDYLVGAQPICIIQTIDTSYKQILEQLPWVGSNEESELKNQGNQHFLVNAQSYETNSDWCKTLANLIEENTDSASINYCAALNISTQASYVDICHRETSQPLACLGNNQAIALPVQGTCSENICGNWHLVVGVSPEAQSFDPNSHLVNGNVDASINEERLPLHTAASIVTHDEPRPKNMTTICDPLALSTPQNNTQNELLSNLWMHGKIEHSKEKQINLLSSELSYVAASPSFEGTDAFQEKMLDLQPKDGLLATLRQLDRDIDLNKAPPRKPKRKKHRAKVVKEGSSIKESRLNNQVHNTAHGKITKGRNSRSNQCQEKTPTRQKEASKNFHLRKSVSSQGVTDDSSPTYEEILGSSNRLRSQTGACQNDVVAMGNKYKNSKFVSNLVRCGNFVETVNEGFSKLFSPPIARSKKKDKLKNLARQKKHTTKEKYIENEENASALTLELPSSIALIKGKRSPRKKLLQSRKPVMDEVDAIRERLKNLNLDEHQVCSMPIRQEIIPFERKDELFPTAECLSMVPYKDPSYSLKSRRIKPKVVLDTETNRAYNLLMGKGGIEDEADGNENSKKYMEDQREIFKDKTVHFLGCMRILQGDRQFSQWKGSVVDSVVGAFLTQNVSDHLSSSAFIALASRFPLAKNNQAAATNAKGSETTKNTSYSHVSFEVNCQSQEMPMEGDESGASYKSNLSVEERFSYQCKNSVVDGGHEVPWPYSLMTDVSIGMDGSNSCGESADNHIFSHASGFDTNIQADIMPGNIPFCHCISSSESNCIGGMQVNKRLFKEASTEHPSEEKRKVSDNLQGANRSFETSDSVETLAIDDHFQDSEDSNSKAKMRKSRMMNSSHYDHHNSSCQSELFDETTILQTGPPQFLGSELPDKTCEPILLKNETLPDLSVVFLEIESGENEMGNAKFDRHMTPNESIESPQDQGSNLPDKVCESILLQRHGTIPDLNVESAENEAAEIEMGNVKIHGEMALYDLELSQEAQVQPDRIQNAEIVKFDNAGRNVPVASPKDCLTCTHFENNHAHSHAEAWCSYGNRLALGSLSQECASFGECNISSQALPYDLLERSTQELFQVSCVSGCQCSSLTDESQFAASALCCLSQEGNSVAVTKDMIPTHNKGQEELKSKLTLSSIPNNSPIPNNLGVEVPRRPRSTKKSGYIKDSLGRINGKDSIRRINGKDSIRSINGKNSIGRTSGKYSIGKTSGIARATMEMNQGGIKKRLDWDSISKNAKEIYGCAVKGERNSNTIDAANWDAVRCADLEDIADAIKERGMNNILAGRIKSFLETLHTENGCIDLEWLKNIPPDDAKNFLLSVRGLGIKSVECIRLLTLQQHAFPVDTNVGRIVVRLGWVPIEPLPDSVLLHKLEEYPVQAQIQKFLWPRLCTLDQRTLYELHYQMITFGKVFCQKSRPNCNACPMKLHCSHFKSAFESAQLALPAPSDKSLSMPISSLNLPFQQDLYPIRSSLALPPTSSFSLLPQKNPYTLDLTSISPSTQDYGPIIEEPTTPEHDYIDSSAESAVHESFDIDDEEIPFINLSCEATDTCASSMALVVLPPEDAAIPVPKLKNVSRLRTEHQVYEIPDNHQLLSEFDPREPDDPCPYLLSIWSPGETAEAAITSEPRCTSNSSHEYQCEQECCSSCTAMRCINDTRVKGTVLIPCRTAMRGRFPLNGTYFQVNEVFADDQTSLHPVEVPRSWIWNLRRCTVYFSTSIPNIFKGLNAGEIQECFWKGYICVRGFERKSRSPRSIVARLHQPASKKDKNQVKDDKSKKQG